MALAKRSSGGMSGWLAAALLLLAIYASVVKDPGDDGLDNDAPTAVDSAAVSDATPEP